MGTGAADNVTEEERETLQCIDALACGVLYGFRCQMPGTVDVDAGINQIDTVSSIFPGVGRADRGTDLGIAPGWCLPGALRAILCGLAAVTAAELVNLARGIQNFLLAGVEGMAS